jgi:CTP synthase
MTEWKKGDSTEYRSNNDDIGGTMRLGSYEAKVEKNTLAHSIYDSEIIYERHRHRYEVNKEFESDLNKKGVVFSAFSPDGILPEIVEIPDHPWFIGVQFHPELKSKPFDPHPLFKSFISASLKNYKALNAKKS